MCAVLFAVLRAARLKCTDSLSPHHCRTNYPQQMDRQMSSSPKDVDEAIASIRSTGNAQDTEDNWEQMDYTTDVWDQFLDCVIAPGWDKYAKNKGIDFTVALILKHFCCDGGGYYDHEIYVLVVPLGRNIWLMKEGERNDLEKLCSANFPKERLRRVDFDLAYISEDDKTIERSELDKIASRKSIAGSEGWQGYVVLTRIVYTTPFEETILKEYNPGGIATLINGMFFGTVRQPLIRQMIADLRERVSELPPCGE